MNTIFKNNLPNVSIRKSQYYRGRYECRFYGQRGSEIKQWLRDTYGEHDDLIYDNDNDIDNGYQATITDQQLTMLMLRWS
jgi:hypothetical protein